MKTKNVTSLGNDGQVDFKKKNFECSYCGRTFTQNFTLNKHMQLHTGQFSYYCESCRKGFNNSGNYKAHIRAHEGLKYHCEYCSKTYMDKQKLKYHMSVHTGQYKFKCNTCEKGFNIASEYNTHLKSHFKV